jgi:hypothetical protein
MERRVLLVPGDAVVDVDLQAPRQVGGLPIQLLVEPVADPPHALREQQAGRRRVHHLGHALAGPLDDDRADDTAQEDAAPDSKAAFPDLEDALPLRVGHLVPARQVVIEPGADDPERDAPHGDAEDEIPVTAAIDPADPGEGHAARDREQEHQPVHVQHERADVDRARVRRGNRGDHEQGFCRDGSMPAS